MSAFPDPPPSHHLPDTCRNETPGTTADAAAAAAAAVAVAAAAASGETGEDAAHGPGKDKEAATDDIVDIIDQVQKLAQ